MFKKLIHKIHSNLYHYHKKKMEKYLSKLVGARKYNSIEKRLMKNMLNATYGLSVYADTDSVSSPDINSSYPSTLFKKN